MLLRRFYAPIKVVQTTLKKFDPSLPEPIKPDLTRDMEKSEFKGIDKRYNIELVGNNTIEIKETHCIDCGRRLRKNGFNNRITILDKGLIFNS